ncbi:rCG54135, partial [Rattus norvegicus]
MEPQWATKKGRTGWGQEERQDVGSQFYFTKGAGRRRGEVRVYSCLPARPPACPYTGLTLALTLSPCAPAGSRPWGKEASSGPRAPPTWANPLSTPPWPQASPASMRW